MNTRNRKSISLASLAVGVSAAAMIGISGLAAAEDPPVCWAGYPCYFYDPFFEYWEYHTPYDPYIWGQCDPYSLGDPCQCTVYPQPPFWYLAPKSYPSPEQCYSGA